MPAPPSFAAPMPLLALLPMTGRGVVQALSPDTPPGRDGREEGPTHG